MTKQLKLAPNSKFPKSFDKIKLYVYYLDRDILKTKNLEHYRIMESYR